MTSSTLSRRIASLERELGLVLIRRSTRTFVLTTSGQKFYERSQRLLEEAARTREELKADFTAITGHLRIGLPADLASTIPTPVFAKYCRDNDTVSIGIVATQNQPDLSRDRLDLAFAVAHQVSLPESSCIVRHIGSFLRMMFASKMYLKRKGTPIAPEDLKAHDCIRYLGDSMETHWEMRSGKQRRNVTVSGACASSSVIVTAQAAREHLGIAMLPQYLASYPTYAAGLVRVLQDWEGAPAVVFALTADRVLHAKTEQLIRLAQAGLLKRLSKLESETE